MMYWQDKWDGHILTTSFKIFGLDIMIHICRTFIRSKMFQEYWFDQQKNCLLSDSLLGQTCPVIRLKTYVDLFYSFILYFKHFPLIECCRFLLFVWLLPREGRAWADLPSSLLIENICLFLFHFFILYSKCFSLI